MEFQNKESDNPFVPKKFFGGRRKCSKRDGKEYKMREKTD